MPSLPCRQRHHKRRQGLLPTRTAEPPAAGGREFLAEGRRPAAGRPRQRRGAAAPATGGRQASCVLLKTNARQQGPSHRQPRRQGSRHNLPAACCGGSAHSNLHVDSARACGVPTTHLVGREALSGVVRQQPKHQVCKLCIHCRQLSIQRAAGGTRRRCLQPGQRATEGKGLSS